MQQVMSCITLINNTFIDNAEDLDIVMPMYNLVEFFDNYSMASGSLRTYNKHEAMMMRMEIIILVIIG